MYLLTLEDTVRAFVSVNLIITIQEGRENVTNVVIYLDYPYFKFAATSFYGILRYMSGAFCSTIGIYIENNLASC